MGIKGLSSNRKKNSKNSKSQKWHRTLKAEKKKQLPAESVDIENVHLFSKEKLKNKLRNPKNNIKISGKKRQRLTKRLGHSHREKSQMDVEVSDTRPSRRKRGLKAEDEEMREVILDTEVQQASPDVPSTSSTTTASATTPTASKKKKRRGKKGKKQGQIKDAETGENLFTNDEGWEDVEMEES